MKNANMGIAILNPITKNSTTNPTTCVYKTGRFNLKYPNGTTSKDLIIAFKIKKCKFVINIILIENNTLKMTIIFVLLYAKMLLDLFLQQQKRDAPVLCIF